MSYSGYEGNTNGFTTSAEDMREVGVQHGRIASDYEEKINELASEVRALGTIWNDESYYEFKNRFDEFLKEYNSLKGKIEELGNASLKSADIVDDYEENIRQGARNIGI